MRKKFNNNGFTLIELLAVITIMGVLMIVAIPAITKTIQNSREDVAINSVKTFVKEANKELISESTAGNDVPDGKYHIMSDGNVCLDNSLTDPDDCEDGDIFIVEVDGQKVNGGMVEIKNNKVVKIFNIEIIDRYVNQQTTEKYYITLDKVDVIEAMCRVSSGTRSTASGTAYICEVAPGVEKNFYVLKDNGTTVDLIMDSNIVENVAWADMGTGRNYNGCGPFTAYQKLYELTQGWSKVNGTTLSYNTSDISFSITNGDGILWSKDPECELFEYNYSGLKARLPFSSEINSASYLHGGNDYWLNEVITTNGGTFAAATSGTGAEVLGQGLIGIRPVITVNATDLG